MSTTNTDPDRHSANNSGSGQPTAGADSPAMPPSTYNGGKAFEESNSPDRPHSDSGSPLTVPTTNETHPSPSSSYVRQCFLGGNSHWTKWEQLDIGALEKNVRSTGTYVGALLMTAAVVPIIAALISAVAFIVQRPRGPDWFTLPGMPLLLGTVPTLIVWLLLAFLVRRSTAVNRMNMESYDLLLNRLSSLDAQLSILYPQPGETLQGATKPDANTISSPPHLAVAVAMASKEVLDCRNSIYEKLGKKQNLAWVTASGYINLWKEMHNAEEALINIMPRETVIADALYDEMRIQDSKINISDELLKKLRLAVTTLDPSVKLYLQSPPASLQGASSTPAIEPVSAGAVSDQVEMQQRSILREVRHALNDFRDSRWQAIIRARNQQVCSMVVTGLTMYVLLQFTILAGAQTTMMISATAFFLVGALVGLFYRLYNESQISKSIDDYRLALVRLVAIPMFSGLAAVGGVLLTQKFTPLVNVFDPKNMPAELIVAAVFGLTPSLLFSTLQKQTEQYKTDLKSTAATQQGQK